MDFKTLKSVSVIYAIPIPIKEKPIIYTLAVTNLTKKFYLGNNTYTFEVIFPDGRKKYLNINDRYVNNPNGDDISVPFANYFSTYPTWDINSHKIEEDKIRYLIFDNHNILIDKYIELLENHITYNQDKINELTDEVNEYQKKVEFIKKQKYEE